MAGGVRVEPRVRATVIGSDYERNLKSKKTNKTAFRMRSAGMMYFGNLLGRWAIALPPVIAAMVAMVNRGRSPNCHCADSMPPRKTTRTRFALIKSVTSPNSVDVIARNHHPALFDALGEEFMLCTPGGALTNKANRTRLR